jgi:hypothetical protein
MLDQFKHEVTCNYFKSAVGHAVFCKGCEGILDCARAVEFTLYGLNDKIVSYFIICGACAERTVDNVEAVRKRNKLRAEVFDGRAIDWGRGRRIRPDSNPETLEGLTCLEPPDPNQLTLDV